MHVCAETIYQAIYVHARGSLKLDVKKALRSGRVIRKTRTTRFTILLHLPDRHDAGNVQEAIVKMKKMRHLPKLLRNSLTWDQGSEMALHAKIATELQMDVYFCDPHSP